MQHSPEDHKYPAGRPPWDTWNGLRVGALAGGIIGILVAAVASAANFWLAVPGAILGGAIGYWVEKRKR